MQASSSSSSSSLWDAVTSASQVATNKNESWKLLSKKNFICNGISEWVHVVLKHKDNLSFLLCWSSVRPAVDWWGEKGCFQWSVPCLFQAPFSLPLSVVASSCNWKLFDWYLFWFGVFLGRFCVCVCVCVCVYVYVYVCVCMCVIWRKCSRINTHVWLNHHKYVSFVSASC